MTLQWHPINKFTDTLYIMPFALKEKNETVFSPVN